MEFPNITVSKETFSKLFDRVIKGLVPITQDYINTQDVKSNPITIKEQKKRKRKTVKKIKLAAKMNTNLI